ncbi:MAG: hypothetical protein OYH76_21985 [Defluviicoccus sp.]|nr:hypothetical protein [Defluviicoccus sp.]MDE0278577.1 hypothetical protein [Defluviicoccus sp.]
MRRGGDYEERIARIERTMPTRDDIEDLRRLIEGRGTPRVFRRFGRMMLVGLIVTGFVVLVLAFSRAGPFPEAGILTIGG